MSREKVTGSQQQTAQRLKAIIALIFQIFIALMLSSPAFADEGDIDMGTGWTNEVGAGAREWGYNDFAGGYRTYMEGEGGKVVQQVTDIYFADPNGEGAGMNVYKQTAIGNKAVSTRLQSEEIMAFTGPGLEPPLYNHEAWGPEMDAWFEGPATGLNGMSVQTAWIAGAFKGDDVDDLISGYLEGRYRIVVEAIYWWRPVSKTGSMMRDASGNRAWFYGTIKNGAVFDYHIRDLLSENSLPGGGKYLGYYTNEVMATALALDDTDTGFSGFTPISKDAGANTSGEGGIYTYSEIYQGKVGYGMHIIYREKAEEKWYTYKSPSGATGGPEAASPEMPDIPGVQTGGKFRPVTIIKYYEERTVQQDGKTKSDWKTVSGPYSRPQVCRSIVIIYFE